VERRHFLVEAGAGAELEETLEDYPEVVREIALELQLPVVDLNSWTRDLYTELGAEASKELFCHFGPDEHAYWPAGLADNTHFSQQGAALVAKHVASQLADLGLAPGSRESGSREPDGREIAGSSTALRPPEDLAAVR
jgi:lysophospholipase L1-like esterase